MSVGSGVPYNAHLGNGLSVVFGYGFTLLDAADLVVTIDGVVTSAYTVSGVGVAAGGFITFSTAPANGAAVLLQRVIQLVREAEYQNNGDLQSDTVNADFDRLSLAVQQNSAGIERTLRVPEVGGVTSIPAAAARANFLLGFNSAGEPIAVAPVSGSATELALNLASAGDGLGGGLVVFSRSATYDDDSLGKEAQATAALRDGRTAPHANFSFFTADFTVTSCPGPGRATVAQDLRDVWLTKYSATMTGGTTYVDGTNGSDANAGNVTAPWQTIDKAIRTSNSGLVHVMPGTYDWTGFRYTDTQGDRPKMLVAPYGGVTIRVSGDTVSAATFAPNGTYSNVYETTLVTANHVTRLLRTDRLDSLGLPTPMPKQASLVGVNDAGYGWWYDSATSKLYVRDGTLNINSAVKANLSAVYATGGDNSLLVQSAKLYIENITLLRYPWSLKVVGQAVPEVWLKNCTVRYAESTSRLVQGGACYSQGSTYYRSAADHANYTSASGTTAYGVEINDTTLFAGDVDSFGSGATQPNNPISTAQNKNSSSNHDGYVVRINGTHSGSFGPVIADTDGSYTWSLGTHAGYSFATGASRYGFIAQGSLARAWYDGCSTTGNSGLNSDTSAIAYTFNCAGPQVPSSSGTFSAYTPT